MGKPGGAGDLISVVGYAMLRSGWPRAPFVIGLVLGRIAEESLHKALGLWGASSSSCGRCRWS